jgi:hypothetical protein
MNGNKKVMFRMTPLARYTRAVLNDIFENIHTHYRWNSQENQLDTGPTNLLRYLYPITGG